MSSVQSRQCVVYGNGLQRITLTVALLAELCLCIKFYLCTFVLGKKSRTDLTCLIIEIKRRTEDKYASHYL